ncbi:MAG: sigma 54-interacting transcriptional regulator [Oscillibacter sp.]|nr:sigma 54-interacting transcriptional regulator [Oscillibacter sp.]
MDQHLTIRNVRAMLRQVIDHPDSIEAAKYLEEIDRKLEIFHDTGVDFKEIVDNLNDSILITDAQGIVIYINPAYTRNTGITGEDVLGKNIHTLIGPDKLITGGAVISVLESKKSALRLSTTYKTGAPLVGYVSGTPVFDDSGTLRQVIACSRPIITLRSLQEDFSGFLREVNLLPSGAKRPKAEIRSGESLLERYPSMKDICTLIHRVAPTDATILITGESGVGKEVVADEIYRCSQRKDKPYVKLNCTSIPSHLLESELFGYEKGSFTGASPKGKIGLFESANGGTLLLDEIGDMPMDLQVKLLRAIQSQEITRIGGTKPIKLDIRFLALTNADLKKKVDEKSFRQDLYFRLNVIPLPVPPLRERLQDLEPLCQYFIGRFSEKYHHSFRLTAQQMDYMKQYTWPGNIRELQNIIEYMIVFSAGIGQIEDEVLKGLLDITEEVHSSAANQPLRRMPIALPEPPLLDAKEEIDFAQAVANFEKQLLEQVLQSSANLREAGKRLNLNASTISRKIKQYHIDYVRKRT